MKFGCNRPSSFREEVVWNCGRTTEPAYTISSPGAFGSGELKRSTPMTLNPSNPLKIALINFQSILENKPQFFSFVDSYKPDIIVGTETWLAPDLYDSEYIPPELGSTVYRRDRTDQKGQGVIILVNSNLISEEKTEYKSACENLWVQVNLTGSNSVLTGAYYKPHELNQLSFEELNKSLTLVYQTNSTVWLLGGFNLPKVDWQHLKPKPDCSHPTFCRECLKALSNCMLEQMVTSPTPGVKTY